MVSYHEDRVANYMDFKRAYLVTVRKRETNLLLQIL